MGKKRNAKEETTLVQKVPSGAKRITRMVDLLQGHGGMHGAETAGVTFLLAPSASKE